MRCTSVVAAQGGEEVEERKKYLKMEENKYLKERLPSQLHRAEMWKRKSKQAWSLGWFGGEEVVVAVEVRGKSRRNTKQEMVPEKREAEEDEGGEKVVRKMGGRSSGMTASTTRVLRRRRAGDKIKIQIMEEKQVKAYFEWVLSVRERSHVHTARVSVEAGTYGTNKRHGVAGNLRRKVFL